MTARRWVPPPLSVRQPLPRALQQALKQHYTYAVNTPVRHSYKYVYVYVDLARLYFVMNVLSRPGVSMVPVITLVTKLHGNSPKMVTISVRKFASASLPIRLEH